MTRNGRKTGRSESKNPPGFPNRARKLLEWSFGRFAACLGRNNYSRECATDGLVLDRSPFRVIDDQVFD